MMHETVNRVNGVVVKATKSRKPTSKPRKPRSKPSKLFQGDRLAVGVAVVSAVSTVALSMVLNAWAFTAAGWSWFGLALGVLLPLWVLALTFQGHHMGGRSPWVSVGCYLLAGFALVVSLPHLAHGYASLGLHPYEGWSLAVVTDLLQVAMKLSLVRMARKEQPQE